MFKWLLYIFFGAVILTVTIVQTDLKDIFKDENGSTNWQYLANWTSGTLIIILAIVAVNLMLAHSRIRKANRALNAIKAGLEDRVAERTATLDEANTKLIQSNKLLENEVEKHLATTNRLITSESYIKNILASMPSVLVSLDEKGNVTHWNQKAEELSGIAMTSAVGNNLWEVYPQIVLTWAQVQEVMNNGEAHTYGHKHRGIHYYDVTVFPLKGGDNKGVVILVTDVSKQKQAEHMLVHNEKIASMTELASAMAHDINTPLQGMLLDLQSFQQLLSKQTNGGITGENVKKLDLLLVDASKRAETVASIVKNLLSFSRGRDEKIRQTDITELLENTVGLASDMLSLPDELQFDAIEIERNYQKDIPLVNCYPTELQQALLNLIRHSCYALAARLDKSKKPRIEISASLEADGLWVSLGHNGVCLSDEEQTSIFEPSLSVILPQRDTDTKKRLSFVNFIITEQHQGQIAVTSDAEYGTHFYIQLMLDNDLT